MTGLAYLAERAKTGDREALERLLAAVRDDVYNLALKMLWHPADAEDATQDILIRVLIGLGGYRAEAAFTTWVFRIATNHLLTTRKRRMEQDTLSFDEFADDLADGLSSDGIRGRYSADAELLEQEVKIGCTQGMLLCLDREHRIAYVLGEMFGVTSEQAAEILEISAAAYRKRLSRARERIRTFMRRHCGLVDSDNACRCRGRADRAVRLGRIDPGRLLFAGAEAPSSRSASVLRHVAEIEDMHASAAVFRSHPHYAAPRTVTSWLRDILASGRYSVLEPS